MCKPISPNQRYLFEYLHTYLCCFIIDEYSVVEDIKIKSQNLFQNLREAVKQWANQWWAEPRGINQSQSSNS